MLAHVRFSLNSFMSLWRCTSRVWSNPVQLRVYLCVTGVIQSEWRASCAACKLRVETTFEKFAGTRCWAVTVSWKGLYCTGKMARGSTVGRSTALQAGRSRVRFPMVSLEFFIRHNPSGRNMALRSTQPLR